MKLVLVTALLLFLAGAAPANAAGIDCTKAESPREKMICNNPKLLKLDADMANLYAERLARLSPEGQKAQRNVQVGWLAYMSKVCNTSAAPDAKSAERCLNSIYGRRLRDLNELGISKGPYVFNNIVIYAAEPAPLNDRSGEAPGFYSLHVSYPQIDNVKTRQAESFNKKIVRKDSIARSCDGNGNGDVSAGFVIGAAAENLVAVEDGHGEYCHGDAHGYDESNGKIIEFSQESRELDILEVFGPEMNWQTKLSHLVDEAISFGDPADDKKDVRDTIIQGSMRLSNWFITREGFQRETSSYDGGCYACRVDVKTIPWSDIKPLLPPNSPLWRFINNAN